MSRTVADEISSVPWYHTIELPGGEATPGYFDLRSIRAKVKIPDLTGKRCLDVGSSNGYWAFEMEKCGASEVVSLDLDDKSKEDWAVGLSGTEHPVGISVRGFEIAKRHLDSKVERFDASIYDITPELVGEYDFVFIGSLLLHLRDPIGGLTALRSVCRGELFSLDGVSPWLTAAHPRQAVYGMWATEWQQWFLPNRAGRRRMLEVAGFTVSERGPLLHQRLGAGYKRPSLRRLRSPRTMALALYHDRVGVPSDWYRAR